MKGREVLGKAAEIVTFLFAMFGGFLKDVAPPEEAGAGFAVGFASFLVLILLLFVSVVAKGRLTGRRRKMWIAAAACLAVIAVASGFVYQDAVHRLTFYYPPETREARYVAGTRYTVEARPYADAGMDPAQILARFGPEHLEEVWPKESVDRARTLLTANYLVLVLSLASTIFCLIELFLAGESSALAPTARRKVRPIGSKASRTTAL